MGENPHNHEHASLLNSNQDFPLLLNLKKQKTISIPFLLSLSGSHRPS